MTTKKNLREEAAALVKDMKEFAITVGEQCPEGHRRDPSSGACLPMGPTDHTAFTRSLNDDQGDLWRGLKDKEQASEKEQAVDASEMEELSSCAAGTVFSFIQKKCVSHEEAEAEDNDGFAMSSDSEYEEVEEEMEETEQGEGHSEVVKNDPEGRRDPVGFHCPENHMFDFKRRECIPMNKDTMMSSEVAKGETEEEELLQTTAAPITTKMRKGLPSSAFGVPGKRKFPLDTCARVRNAMARFNQAKGLTPAEKATLRSKILSAAKKCGIEVRNFAKAESTEDFVTVALELLSKERVMKQYSADQQTPAEETDAAAETPAKKQGPCPPWMEWDPKAKKCGKVKGYYTLVREQAAQSDLVPDPAGRQDTPGFQCPSGFFFDFKNRKCLALDPSQKDATSTSKASEEDAYQRDLTPQPAGRPARLPQDCPAGTLWNADREDCIPLSAIKKTKSAEETAGSEGLTPAPDGKVKLPSDCPAGTMWDGVSKTCTPLDSRDKSRPGTAGPQSPKSFAGMSIAKVISVLDEVIKVQDLDANREKSRVIARDLPNEAFPPSLVGSTRRNLMHHTPEVTDAYDNASVDVARLRNALARIDKLEGYSPQAIADARAHLLFHAQEIVENHLGKN